MKRSWIRSLATLAVGLACAVAFTTTNIGCACGRCGHHCDKPCCKKPCDKPCDKKEEPKKP